MTPRWKRSPPRDPYAHLDHLLQLTPDGVLGVDVFGDITVVNGMAESLFGFPADDLVGSQIEVVLPHIFGTDLLGRRTEYLSDPSEHRMGSGLELTGRRRDGFEFPVELASTPHLVENEQIVLLFVRDITVRKTAEDLAKHREQELKALSQRMITTQEEDRARIARDLHDDISQRLHAAAIGIGPAIRAMTTDQGEATARLKAIQEQLDGVAEDTRRISHELHPAALEILGLAAAIEGLCDEHKTLPGTSITASVGGLDVTVPPEVALGLYRMTQETLSNIAKHAEAKAIKVELASSADTVRLTIEDDGLGFDPTMATTGLGLASMRERARLLGGTLTIESTPGSGTVVLVEVPLQSSER